MTNHPARLRIDVDSRNASLVRCELLCEFTSPPAASPSAEGPRFSIDGLEKVVGDAQVRTAIVSGMDLRYTYVNESYRAIRPDLAMVGKTYREVFPEAAAGGAEANLQRVIASGKSWVVEDYPTPLPGRDMPAWWQGECVPIALAGAQPDAVLILIWEVTRRHLAGAGPAAASREHTRVETARTKLAAHMSALGLTAERGWRISEQVRETDEGTEWILRPMHLREDPPRLEARVVFERPSVSR